MTRPSCRVLVTCASKHGATQEIGEALARDLRRASGPAVEVVPLGRTTVASVPAGTTTWRVNRSPSSAQADSMRP